MQRQQLAQLGGEALGMLQVLHAQRAARNLVLVGRADALAGRADLARAARLAQQLARLVDFDVERQDQRARFADAAGASAPRAPSPRDVRSRRAGARDRRRRRCRCSTPRPARMIPDGISCSAVLTPSMTSVWPALWPPWKRTTRLRVVGQPVDDLALALVAPLGADDDDVATGRRALPRACSRSFRKVVERSALDDPAAPDWRPARSQLAFAASPPCRAARDHDLAARAQLAHGAAQRGIAVVRRADRLARTRCGARATPDP